MPRLFDGLELPASADFHVHLRQGAMMETVTPTITSGGVDTVYVMPNLIPPITTPAQAVEYKSRLQALAPDVTFLMSLYLHPSITPSIVREAKATGAIHGIKSYPAGVTTNSSSGVVDYESFYPVFAAMEEEGLVLNLHGELPPSQSPSAPEDQITVLNAEAAFLPTLRSLHTRFPNLRIVLEHCTTKAAVDMVLSISSPNVVGTITAHHLSLIVDDWAGDPLNFCKPVAKLPSDRIALLRAAVDPRRKFFLGTDSAPHPLRSKQGRSGTAGNDNSCGKCAAGVFTQPYATQLVLEALEEAVSKGILREEDVRREGVLEGFWARRGGGSMVCRRVSGG
ncbi:Dihydroorotase [Cyphellophora attinorum]|uniref:Dihydroorotase n=1 Tax=Cyphellophora attinorum TaxID=1664694 RepID=A0A0N1HWL7_9EURO|nr:Dihydroorotase [Phialophora attinorum]KPI44643.1 Dihydroorotase [Phialophora attinorum]